jgi:hypothetical protein
VRPEPPAVANGAWIRNPIDRFVLARLEREGLAPAPEADRETLIRRVSLDLIGLPPTLAEVDAFLADTSADAYEKVVDRLLASPHYGERWARPWLDLARYADTNGYEKDGAGPPWMYRDWVIDALNRDLSFRDFTIQQIGGDLLPRPRRRRRSRPGSTATRFSTRRAGSTSRKRGGRRWSTASTPPPTRGWAAPGLRAVPQPQVRSFSQKDYYRMLAFFDNAEYRVEGLGEVVKDKWIVEPDLELAPPEVLKKRDALKAEAEELKKTIDASDLGAELAAWESALAPPAPRWKVLRPVQSTSAYAAVLAKKGTALSWCRGRRRTRTPTPSPRRSPARPSRPCASRRSPIRRCPRTGPAVRHRAISFSPVSACARARSGFRSCGRPRTSPRTGGASRRRSTRARTRAGGIDGSRAVPIPRSSFPRSRSVAAGAC